MVASSREFRYIPNSVGWEKEMNVVVTFSKKEEKEMNVDLVEYRGA